MRIRIHRITFVAYPGPSYHVDADPDPTFQFDADPDPLTEYLN
jgi:hypothetical protein